MSPASESDASAFPVIVLAAGRGRRMGGPKALMQVAGRVWWRNQERRIGAAARALGGLKSCWVASPDVMAAWAGVADRPAWVVAGEPDAPMFVSVAAGVRAVAAGQSPVAGVFVLPVDVPAAADGAVWRGLASVGSVARPVHGGKHGHPLYLPWPWVERELRPRLNELGGRLDELISSVVSDVAVSDECVVWNLNTPEDVSLFERVCSQP